MTILDYDNQGFIMGVRRMSQGIDNVHDDTQEIIQILKSQNQIANTKMSELTRAVRHASARAAARSNPHLNRRQAPNGAPDSPLSDETPQDRAARRSANRRASRTSRSNNPRPTNDNNRRSNTRRPTISGDSDNAADRARTRRPSNNPNGGSNNPARERDENGRFTGGSQSASQAAFARMMNGFKGVTGNGNIGGVDPVLDSLKEAKDLLSPLGRAAKLGGRAAKFSVSKLKAMKRREPLPIDQDRHNNENEKLLDKIWKAIRKTGEAGGGMLGGLLGGRGGRGGGRRGRGALGRLRDLGGRGLRAVGGIKALGAISAVAGAASLGMDWKGLNKEEKTERVGQAGGGAAGALVGGTIGSVVPVVGTAIGAVVGGYLGAKGGAIIATTVEPHVKGWTDEVRAYNLPKKMRNTWDDGIKPFFATMTRAANKFYEASLSAVSAAIDNVGNFIDGGMDGITSANAGANGATAANLSEKQNKNQMMVYESFRNAGLSDAQARAMTAEVGRENSYQDKYLFGGHSDPANNEYNLGMFSWQKERGKKLYKHLNSKGMIKNGKIIQSQEALNEQARFAVNEINTDPSYSRTKKEFLNNSNVSYGKANEVLGNNYIRWRYTDPKYAKHHKYRDQYKALIDKQLKSIEDTNIIDEAKEKTGEIAQNVKGAVTQKQPNSKEVGGSLANKAKNNSSALGVQVGNMRPSKTTESANNQFADNKPLIFKSSTNTPASNPARVGLGDMKMTNNIAASSKAAMGYGAASFAPTPMLNIPSMPKIAQRLDSGSSDKPLFVQTNNDTINQNVSDRDLAHAITGGLGQSRQWG